MWLTLLFYLVLTGTTIVIAALVSKKPVDFYQSGKGLQLNNREEIKDFVALLAIYLLLTLVLILRVNIGNDYFRYTQIMHELRYNGYVITEPGFNLVCKFFLQTKLWWNQGYLLCFAVIGIATIAFFLKGMYALSEDFFLSFFLFMTLGMYYQTFSTVRYYLALGIVLYSVKDLLLKKYLKFILWILLAASFHKIALIAIPVYFLAIVPWKKWHLGIFAVLALQFLFGKNFYLKMMLRLYPSYEGETAFLAGGTSIANIVRCLLVFLLCVIYYQKCIENEPKNRFFFHLNLVALALYTCGYYIPVISRVGYLLNISQLFLIPAIISAIEDTKKRKLLMGIVFAAGVGYYLLFNRDMVQSLHIVPYQSWIFQEMTPINMLDW